MIYQIVHDTKWSLHEVLWKVSRANLLLMMADRSNFMNTKDIEEVKEESGADLFNRIKKPRG